MKQLYVLDEPYNEMKTRSQTRELRFPEPLLEKMGDPLPLLSNEGEAEGGGLPVLRHFFQNWVCATFPKRGSLIAQQMEGCPSPEGNGRGTCELEVNIDFDLASKAWRANKKYIGDGSFKYVRNKYKEKAQLRSRLQGGV